MDVKEYNIKVAHSKQNHPWEYARFEVVADMLNATFDGKQKHLNIVDVGCGDAFFSHQLSEYFVNCNFFAVDSAFTPDTIASFEEKYKGSNIKFYQKLSDVSSDCNRIDLILLMDVIEHVEDDIALLLSLRALQGFHSETVLVVTVPAYQSLFCSHDEWIGHYRRYTIKMLQQRLRQAGFSPAISGYFFFSLLLPRILKKSKELLVKSKADNITGIGNWGGGKFLSALVKNSLVMDYKISKVLRSVGVKLPGLSCYSISKVHNK